MKQLFLFPLLYLAMHTASAQTEEQKDSIKKTNLNEVIISGNNFSEQKKNIVQKVDVIN